MFMNQSPVALPETRNGKWMTMAPSHCPNGHGLGVGNGSVGAVGDPRGMMSAAGTGLTSPVPCLWQTHPGVENIGVPVSLSAPSSSLLTYSK